jgi:hypothetical protein
MPDVLEEVELPPVDPTANEAALVARFIREAEEAAARITEARAARNAANAAALLAAASVGTDSEVISE